MTLTSFPLTRALLGLPIVTLLACGNGGDTSVTDSGNNTFPATSNNTNDPDTTAADTSTGEPTTAGSLSESNTAATSSGTTTVDPSTSTSTTAVSDPGTSTTDATDTTSAVDTSSSTSTTAADTSTSEPGDTSTSEPGTTGSIDTCAEWSPIFEAKVLEIRSCDMDSECGQELVGTSCGCTRNWVALKDADVTEFWALVDIAMDLGCELPFFSTCDCPGTDGFACVAGICTWNYI